MLAVFLRISFSYAQENDSLFAHDLMNMSLDELLSIKVSVSSTQPDNIFDVPSTVSIITKETIMKYHFQSVPEVLSVIPGIDVLQTIIDRNITTPRGILQNFYANKILILINNVPTWQPIYGNGQLERINVHDIQRIEVLKGPASVLYGSNAYAAVINIILDEPDDNELEVHAEAGYPKLISSGFSLSFAEKDWKNRLYIHTSSEQRPPYEMPAAEGHEYNGDSAFMYTERYINRSATNVTKWRAHSLLINIFEFDHSFLGEHPSYAGGAGNLVENSGILLNYSFSDDLGENLHLNSNLTYDYFHRQFPLTADRVQLIRLAGSRYAGDVKVNAVLNKNLGLEVGVMAENRVSHGHETRDALTDTLIRSNLTQDDDIQEYSGFLQLSSRFGAINLLLGGRYTYNSHFGDNFSLRGTAVYRLNPKNSIKVIAGQSFRVPTMFELYFDHRSVRGSRDLMPETSNSIEFSYQTQFGNFYLQSIIYFAQYKNLIQRVTVEDAPSIYRNTDQFEGYGLEIELNYRYQPRGEFFINYNYINGSGDDDYANFRYVPDHTISAGANTSFGRFIINTNGNFVSPVEGAIHEIPVQYYVNAGFTYRHEIRALQVSYHFNIKNITANRFEIPEYIRKTPNINSIPTMAYGRQLIFSIHINY